MSEQYKTLMEKSLSCLHMARAINDRYPDPSKMPAEEFENRKALLQEGQRLRNYAETQRQQDELEGWAAAPAEEHPALRAMAEAGHSKAEREDALEGVNSQLESKAFFKWLRGGMGALSGEERKALRYDQKGSWGAKAPLVEDATGEVLVPHDITGPIFKELPHLGTFRSSRPLIRRTTSNKVDVRSLTGATAGWSKLETGGATVDANVVASTPTQVIEVHDLIGLSKVGVDELADSDANLAALIQQIVGLQFAQMEDDAFANGTGTSQPWGLAMRSTMASPPITQAVTASPQGAVTGDDIKKLPFAVPTVYRNNGVYYASDDAAQGIALLKDGNSNYLWQPSFRAGEPATLNGYRFFTLEGLPALTATSAPSVMFGDPNLGYMLAERQDVAMQRLDELFATNGQVGFLFKLRIGGDVIRPKAFAKYIV